MGTGKFIISLDFELHWGAAEKWDLKTKAHCFNQTRILIPQMLELFKKYSIHATWATVGFLFAKNKKQLLEFMPQQRPSYDNKSLSYYSLIDKGLIGDDEENDPYHYASSIIEKIIETPHQELATHTFSHYYCNEIGQQPEEFDADLKAAQNLSIQNFNTKLHTLVFPRNQFNENYLDIAYRNGIKVVRSNPDVWFWNKQNKLSPLMRAIDTIASISPSLTFDLQKHINFPLLLPASRFLRPYSAKETLIQSLKIKRIKNEMTYAAIHKRGYHLWWHPENFGDFPEKNLQQLEDILNHYTILNYKYGFSSQSMIEMINPAAQ